MSFGFSKTLKIFNIFTSFANFHTTLLILKYILECFTNKFNYKKWKNITV